MAKVEIKKPIVDEIKGYLEKANGIILIDYCSLTVEEYSDFERKMRQACLKYGVYKNTYLNFAFEGSAYTVLAPHLEGPTSVAFLRDDYHDAEDIICEFSKTTPLTVKGAVIEGVYYDEKSFYSKVKERQQEEYNNEHIHEMVIAGMRLPITRLEYVLKRVLKQKQREEREREFDEWNNDYIRVHGEKAFNKMLSCLSWREGSDYVVITSIQAHYLNVEELWIPAKINGKPVVAILGERMYFDLSNWSVKQIHIPNSVTEIMYGVFSGFRGLQKIKIPRSVKCIGEREFENNSIKEIIVEEGNLHYTSRDFEGNECNALIETATRTLLLGCSTTKIPDGIVKIGKNAFVSDAPRTLRIPKSVQEIQFSEIFVSNNLERIFVDVGNEKYTSRDVNGMECNVIVDIEKKEIMLGCGQTVIPEGITHIGKRAFYGCQGLSKIALPSCLKTIGKAAFGGCGNLAEIVFSKGLDNIEEDAFWNCNKPKKITLSESVEDIEWKLIKHISNIEQIVVDPKNKKYTSRDANGKECNAVIEIENNTLVFGCGQTVIPEGVIHIGIQAFFECKDLTKIVFPESVKTIGIGAFFCCDNLTDIVFSEGLKIIEYDAFYGCDNLEKIILPKELEVIDSEAFDCRGLCQVTVLSPHLKDLTGVFDEKVKIIYAAEESLDVNEESETVSEEVVKQNDKGEENPEEGVLLSMASELSSKQDDTPNNNKPIRVLVFAKGDKANEAKEAGADYVGAEELYREIMVEGWLEFDVVVSTPDMMGVVGRLGSVLGPKGLMPSPWAGTITMDVAKVVRELKKGNMAIPSEKTIGERMEAIRASAISLKNSEIASNGEHKEKSNDLLRKMPEMSYGVRRDTTKPPKKKIRWIPLVIILFVLGFFALGLFGVI